MTAPFGTAPLFLCHSAQRRVTSFSLTTPLSSARADFSSTPAFLHWPLSDLSSCMSWVNFTSGQFGIGAAVVLVPRCSLKPNLSEAMLIMNMLIVRSLWSTSPLAVASRLHQYLHQTAPTLSLCWQQATTSNNAQMVCFGV